MEITIYKPDQTITQKIALAATLEKRFIDHPETDRRNALANLIKITFYQSGHKLPTDKTDAENEIKALTVTFIRIIENKFKAVRFAELQLAFESGANGFYGDYFGLNTRTFSNWVQSYLNDPLRREALTKAAKPTALIPETAESEKDAVMMEAVMKKRTEYALNGFVSDRGSAVYDYLDSSGVIDFTDQEKIEFFNSAKLILENRLNSARGYAAKIRAKFGNAETVREAKVLALNEYFRKTTN